MDSSNVYEDFFNLKDNYIEMRDLTIGLLPKWPQWPRVVPGQNSQLSASSWSSTWMQEPKLGHPPLLSRTLAESWLEIEQLGLKVVLITSCRLHYIVGSKEYWKAHGAKASFFFFFSLNVGGEINQCERNLSVSYSMRVAVTQSVLTRIW